MMNRLLLLLAFAMLFSSAFACADIGPKPSMEFHFVYETPKAISIINGEQIQCEDESCLDAKPLEQLGPQRFTCSENSCSSMAYGYAPYQKLVINFSDKTRESNVFKSGSFNGNFEVTVTDSRLVVRQQPHSVSIGGILLFIIALAITLILEFIVALAFLWLAKMPMRILAAVLMANLISLPIIWFIFPLFESDYVIVLAISEIFALIFEACLILILNRKSITPVKAILLILLTNLASFILGWPLLLIISFL